MCLVSCPMDSAAKIDATRARSTASGSAPPPKAAPVGMESAVAMAGAMNVMDWNSTPPKRTEPRRRPSSEEVVAGVAVAAGPPEGGSAWLIEHPHDRRARPSEPTGTQGGADGTPDGDGASMLASTPTRGGVPKR